MTLLQSTLTPSQQALSLTGRHYISYSQINLFRGCPLRYAFNYVEHVPPEFIPASYAFGQAIHAGIAMACQIAMSGESFTLDDMLESYTSTMSHIATHDPDIPIRFNQSHPDTDAMYELARRMLQTFIDVDKLEGLNILAVEQAMRGHISEDLPEVLSYADLIVEEEDRLRIIDFKTSRSQWKPEDLSGNSDQLLLYRLLGQSIVREFQKPMHLEYIVLTKSKKPVIQQFEVQVDLRRLRRLETVFRQIWRAIQTENFYPVPSPMHCSTCQWKQHCEAHK